MKEPFDLCSIFHELRRLEQLCALPLEVAYFSPWNASDPSAAKAAFENIVNWQVSVFGRFDDLKKSLEGWTPEIVITHDHVGRDEEAKHDWGGTQRYMPRLWAYALRQKRLVVNNGLVPFLVGQVSSFGYRGPVPRHSLGSGALDQKPIEVNEAYDMVIHGSDDLADIPWDIAPKLWDFLNKQHGLKADRPSPSDIGSRIRVVSKFIQHKIEGHSLRGKKRRDSSPVFDYFSRCAETWCIRHAGESIEGRNWSKQKMLGACFDKSCLNQCDFRDCRLVGSTFKGAQLEGVNFDNAVMDGVAMQEAKLVNCSLTGARFLEANLDSADLRGLKLSNVGLKQTSLIGANLASVELRTTPLSSSKMQGCNMTEARCDELEAYHADFRQAVLAGATLTKAKLYGGKFDGANLAGCDLSGANIENCCFLGVAGITASQIRSTEGWEFALFDEDLMREIGLAGATAFELNNPAFRKKIGLKLHEPKLREQLINYQTRMNAVRSHHGLPPVVVIEKTIWPNLLDYSSCH
jgi:uncharacterized protein YjbI with pentapeptide repeats